MYRAAELIGRGWSVVLDNGLHGLNEVPLLAVAGHVDLGIARDGSSSPGELLWSSAFSSRTREHAYAFAMTTPPATPPLRLLGTVAGAISE
jgi:hypothetical protein